MFQAELKKQKAQDWLLKTFPKPSDPRSEPDTDEEVENSQDTFREINSMLLTPMCTVFWPTTDKSCGGGLTHVDKAPLSGERNLEEIDDPCACGVLPLVSHIISMPQVKRIHNVVIKIVKISMFLCFLDPGEGIAGSPRGANERRRFLAFPRQMAVFFTGCLEKAFTSRNDFHS